MRFRTGLSRLFRLGGSIPTSVKPTSTQAHRYFYLGPELALVKTRSGHLVYVDPLDEHVSANIIAHGYWEAWVHKVVMDLLRPGDRVVEIGANVGYYTVTMADRIGPTGFQVALEANPRMASLIQRSAQINGFTNRLRLICKAAMNESGEIDFVISRRNSGGGYVSFWDHQPYEDGEKLRVEAVRLDDLELGSANFIRIDAEGSEAFILYGAAELLQRSPDVVICMEWSVLQISSRTSVPDFIGWMTGQGFMFWKIGYSGELSLLAPEALADLPNCDIVACRNDQRTQVLVTG